jgi:hypothetical protein
LLALQWLFFWLRWPLRWLDAAMSKIIEFVSVFWLYAKHNPINRAARIAYGIAFKGLPF